VVGEQQQMLIREQLKHRFNWTEWVRLQDQPWKKEAYCKKTKRGRSQDILDTYCSITAETQLLVMLPPPSSTHISYACAALPPIKTVRSNNNYHWLRRQLCDCYCKKAGRMEKKTPVSSFVAWLRITLTLPGYQTAKK
jgi:hypothetical protein